MLSINALLFLPILNILLLKRVSWCVGLLTLVDWSHWLHHAITNRATKLKFFMQTQCLYFKSIWGHWGHLCDKSRNINFAFSWSGCIQSEIGSPAVTVYLLCLRLLWSFFFFSRCWFKCEHFFPLCFRFFSSSQPAGEMSGLRSFHGTISITWDVFGKRGIFQPCVSVSPPAWTTAHKLFMWCHVKELLQHLPAGTASVCACVSYIVNQLGYCLRMCVM